MPQPFEVPADALHADIDSFVDEVYAGLESSFLVMPRGDGYVEYPDFQEAYECLKRTTKGFRILTTTTALEGLRENGLVFVVLRTMLGMTPPEWAALAAGDSGSDVPQNAARQMDKKARTDPKYFGRLTSACNRVALERLEALVTIACSYINEGAPAGAADTVHRLDKVDTAQGLASVQRVADLHVPYATLLYERYLGRPFASHRDTVSELVGDVMESAVEAHLQSAHVTFRKTKRATQVPGFDQAPDFIIPDEMAPQIVIEAKITNDDGTARDKITRIIHLTELSRERVAQGLRGFEVVACIDGRGFGIRREDMRRLIVRTQGKVFKTSII